VNRIRTVLGVSALFAALPGARADELAELLKRVPAEMNTVAVINVRAINKSPRAVKENWRDTHETEYLAGALAVPASVPVVVIAADLHPEDLAHGKSLALVPVSNLMDSDTLAMRENGVVQALTERFIVLSPRRGYLGVPAMGVLGVSANMPRQDFARWFHSAARPEKPVLAPYLSEAAAAHPSAHILIATDLTDLLDPTAVRAALQKAGPKSEAELDSLVRVLAGARGLVFTAQVGSPSKAEVRLDFSVPMADFVGPLGRVWPKAMEAAGFDIGEFKAAEARADGKAVVLSAELSDTSLRRILSLVHAPGDAAGSQAESASDIQTPKEAAALSASVRYYRAVNAALDDLRAQGGTRRPSAEELRQRERERKSDNFSHYTRSAVFFETYANKLDKLPLTNVDPVLIQYGASVTAKLRAMAGSLRGLKSQLEAFDNYKSTVFATGGWGGWRWGGGGTSLSTNVPEMSTKQGELVAALEPEREKIWSVLEGDRSAVRRELLEKYKIDFERYKK
jgi:hypothetical protein